MDKALVTGRDPLLTAYVRELIKRQRKQISGMERAKSDNFAALTVLRKGLAELETIYREAVQWQR